MGLAAFNRMRREQAQKEAEKQKKQKEESAAIEELPASELQKVKNDVLKQRLDELNINYQAQDKKKDLIVLLKGGAGEEDGQTEQGNKEGQEVEEEQEEKEE